MGRKNIEEYQEIRNFFILKVITNHKFNSYAIIFCADILQYT